jgi:multiple sugar transport system substrate-binding protein/putative aldouronate transport system substrate-binding protein
MKKKALSVLLASAMVVSLAACGSSSSDSSSSSSSSSDSTATSSSSSSSSDTAAATTEEAEPYNLTEINVVVNGTLTATEDNGQAEFVEQWEAAVSEKLGHDIKLNITQFDHSGYTDAVGRLFAGGDLPDVMIMSADMFKQYAPTGYLWDMADAYDNAEFQSRLNLTGINEGLKDSEGHLYGFAPAYGNGCVTYVKQSWLDAVGLSIDDIKTYDDYYNMLLAFHNGDPDGNGVDGDTYGVIAAGYIGTEAPWINYLPEFWQDAYPSLVQDDDGVWYDGFQTDETKAAIERIKQGVDDGAIDPDTLTASTKIAREKFFSNDQTGSEGVFTYWAGSWYQTLTDNLIKNGVETDLVQLPAIAEVGSYLNREAPVWVIIDDQDGDNSREQAIFDAFIDTMLDGDVVQTLWTYGAEDVHWSTHAEEFTTNPGTDNAKDYSYEEGQFHLKQSPNDSNTVWKKNAMDPALVVSPLTNGYNDISELAVEGNEFFTSNCIDAPTSPSCETWTEYSGEIISARGEAISKVVSGQSTVDEAMAEYVKAVGEYVDQALSELNAQ